VAQELTNDVFEALSGIAESSQLTNLENMVEDYEEQVKKEQEQGITLTGLDTKSKNINKLTGGLNKADLIILAARPGMGKSVRAWKFLTDSCESGMFFSLEMSKTQLAQRVVAGECGITLNELKERNIPSHVWDAIGNLLTKLKGSKITIQDRANISLETMEADIKKHILLHGVIELVVVDYLQLMDGGKEGNREQQIGKISRGLKNLAKKYNIPVISLAQ
jgi:replicative DNA helicase